MSDMFMDYAVSVGLGGLPDHVRLEINRQVQDELEMRVGTRLSAGMSDEQLSEFEALLQGDHETAISWLQTHLPGFRCPEDLPRLETGDTPDLSEYTATLWLRFHRPDYQELVKAGIEEIRFELLLSRDAILAAFS